MLCVFVSFVFSLGRPRAGAGRPEHRGRDYPILSYTLLYSTIPYYKILYCIILYYAMLIILWARAPRHTRNQSRDHNDSHSANHNDDDNDDSVKIITTNNDNDSKTHGDNHSNNHNAKHNDDKHTNSAKIVATNKNKTHNNHIVRRPMIILLLLTVIRLIRLTITEY